MSIKQSIMVSVSICPRRNICDFDGWRWDLNYVALYEIFLIYLLNRHHVGLHCNFVSVKFDGDLISDLSDSSSGRYSESVTQH